MNWLAKNIIYSEMIFSDYAARNNIANIPPDELNQNLDKTASALQIVRAYYNVPLVVSSGYRCEELNAAVGGSEKSHHTLGLAADFTIPGVSLEQIMKDVPLLLNFDQIILEYNSWIHLSVHPRARGEVRSVI